LDETQIWQGRESHPIIAMPPLEGSGRNANPHDAQTGAPDGNIYVNGQASNAPEPTKKSGV
jgi:hypothetical protein